MNDGIGKPKHTPGPWLVRPICDHDVIDIIKEGFGPGDAIAVISAWGDPERIADAHLIAAAPDLLKALEAINSHWEAGNFSRKPELWEPMRAAIAKAKGEQPFIGRVLTSDKPAEASSNDC
jgi:hypothetical protein